MAASHELLTPPVAGLERIFRVHESAYVERLLKGQLSRRELRDVGLPWSPQIIERARQTVAATVETCRWALEDGIALHLGGGTHHAFADRARGFCWLNDCAVAARSMIAEGLVERVLILDCDVHQGDGTAAIFRSDPAVFTFSMHGTSSYPYRKEPGDLDIELPRGTGNCAYLETLEKGLDTALQRFQPDLVLYLAGADVFVDDRYGSLSLTAEGIARRDRSVLSRFAGANIPVAITLAGGYAWQIEDVVEIHFQTARIASEFFRGPHLKSNCP